MDDVNEDKRVALKNAKTTWATRDTQEIVMHFYSLRKVHVLIRKRTIDRRRVRTLMTDYRAANKLSRQRKKKKVTHSESRWKSRQRQLLVSQWNSRKVYHLCDLLSCRCTSSLSIDYQSGKDSASTIVNHRVRGTFFTSSLAHRPSGLSYHAEMNFRVCFVGDSLISSPWCLQRSVRTGAFNFNSTCCKRFIIAFSMYIHTHTCYKQANWHEQMHLYSCCHELSEDTYKHKHTKGCIWIRLSTRAATSKWLGEVHLFFAKYIFFYSTRKTLAFNVLAFTCTCKREKEEERSIPVSFNMLQNKQRERQTQDESESLRISTWSVLVGITPFIQCIRWKWIVSEKDEEEEEGKKERK